MSENEVTTVLFTRVQGLATVVWNPRKDRMLCHFSKQGLLATQDVQVIEVLREMGYREVTADQITQAGLTVPGVKDVHDAGTPGLGYREAGPGGAGTAMAGGPGPGERQTTEQRKGLFEPGGALPEPPPGGRKLVD